MRWEGGGSQASLREGNRRRVVRLLRTNGPLTRAELARQAEVSRSTISAIVTELLDQGLVEERGETSTPGQAGRPGSLVALNPSAGVAVGIDIDHQHLRVMAADLAHTVLGEAARPLALNHDASEAMSLAVELVDAVLREAGLDRRRVLGVGMSLAGPIESTHGTVRPSSISPSWVGIDAAAEMSARLDLPVLLDNDANLGALAELMWGAARGVSEGVYLNVGTGIGAGLIIGGAVYRGANGTAGEIGHATASEGGPMCRCGNRGCLERFAGGTAILQDLAGSHGDELTLDDLLAHVAAGENACRRVVSDAGYLIGIHVATLCNLLNPARVIVGGPLSATGDVLLEPIRRSIARSALPAAAEAVDVVQGDLGDRATALGAVALVLRQAGPGLFDDRIEGRRDGALAVGQ
ncbi:MAG TPA: ROK family transcriptional regulator [Actinomycetota bacterium]